MSSKRYWDDVLDTYDKCPECGNQSLMVEIVYPEEGDEKDLRQRCADCGYTTPWWPEKWERDG